jgi:hypothetical protein
LNTLDGFNLQPRLSIPFTGPIDPSTASSRTVFLFALGADPGFVGINQVVWDPESKTLYAESDQTLDQHRPYLLVVTDGVRDTTGDPIVSAEKIRDQLAAQTPAPADFMIGSSGERTVFPLADIAGISWRRQDTTAPSFTTIPAPLASLRIVPGAIGTVAFGRYSSPDYETADGVIPAVGTKTGVPEAQGTNEIYFNLFLPAGTERADGWPVVIAGHCAGNGKNIGNVPSTVAAKLAQHGLITINAVGHGGGPLGTLTVVDVDGDGSPDLDPNRIYYFGNSLGGIYGTLFAALEPRVRASVLGEPGGSLAEALRLNAVGPFRAFLGQLLARTPSLLNLPPGAIDPINTGNTLYPFKENLPGRDQAPVTNDIPGAIPIQTEIDRIEWAEQSADPIAYAPHLRKAPLDGVPVRPVLITLGQGDPVVATTTAGNVLRAGELADRTIYFRTLDAYAQLGLKPSAPQLHEWLVQITGPGAPFALAAQESVDTFLASDGQLTIDPDGAGPLFETPITGPLP